MDTNTRNKNTSSTELVHIGNIGFMFEVNQFLKHNLISPDVLAFFDGVPDSGETTENCAFTPAIPQTSLHESLFQYIGDDWTTCSDGVFRKCKVIECSVSYNGISKDLAFYIDSSSVNHDVAGVLSK